jgi:hypothetical protein
MEPKKNVGKVRVVVTAEISLPQEALNGGIPLGNEFQGQLKGGQPPEVGTRVPVLSLGGIIEVTSVGEEGAVGLRFLTPEEIISSSK